MFAAKPAPSRDRLRGGYYTPDPVARFLAGWAVAAPAAGKVKVLEPSCGDGAILRHLGGSGLDVTAVEIDPAEAAKARALNVGSVVTADFFDWFDPDTRGLFDAVAGNPPFIGFGNWSSQARDRAFDLMRRNKMTPNKLTNAWVPFTVAAVEAVKRGGRVGLVVPAELLHTSYAAQLRDYLTSRCSHVGLVFFDALIFPGASQEVVLLLAEVGDGPAVFRTARVAGPEHLACAGLFDDQERPSLPTGRKWSSHRLDTVSADVLHHLAGNTAFHPLGGFARVHAGALTGRNSFFCLTDTATDRLGLRDWTVPLMAAGVQGLRVTAEVLRALGEQGKPVRLLALPEHADLADPALAGYLAAGEAEGVHTGYKTGSRRHWWSVPSVGIPDGFMPAHIHLAPRLYANDAAATSTTTVHQIDLTGTVTAEQLAVAALNSVTFAYTEIHGRVYGGGMLQLVPSECASLPVADPRAVTHALAEQVDRLLRQGDDEGARVLVDRELLAGRLAIPPADIEQCRRSWVSLRDSRIGRSKRRAGV